MNKKIKAVSNLLTAFTFETINRPRPARELPFYFSVCPYSFRSRRYSTALKAYLMPVWSGQVCDELLFHPSFVLGVAIVAITALALAAALITTLSAVFVLLILLVLIVLHFLSPLKNSESFALKSTLVICVPLRRAGANRRSLAPTCKEDIPSTPLRLRAYSHIRCKSKE